MQNTLVSGYLEIQNSIEAAEVDLLEARATRLEYDRVEALEYWGIRHKALKAKYERLATEAGISLEGMFNLMSENLKDYSKPSHM